MLAEDPDDAFLRYGLALEHASAGDDTACVEVLRDLIARTAANPYIPAFLMTGQALVRLDRILEACHPPPGHCRRRQGRRHARVGEMQGLLDTIE